MSERLPKTIQFFLPQGEPRGIRLADITTPIVQAVLVSRSKLPEAANREELKSVGLYFFFGEPEDEAKPVVYVGEAEYCYKRFLQHNANKDFWHTAVSIVSKTSSFTKAHVKYLEWYCIKNAKEIGRFSLANGNEGGGPCVTEPMLADLMDAFDTLNILISALGFPLFEPRPQAADAGLFVLTGKDCSGSGHLVEDGFTVLAGSKARVEVVPSAPSWLPAVRQELLASGVLGESGGQFVFKEDHTLKTPSGAAMALLGRTANGWKEWKGESGETLAQLRRRQAATPEAN